MRTPETKYAKSGPDHIAYQTVGDGPMPIVLAREYHVSVLDLWDHPSSAYFHRRLAAFGRLLCFDVRGSGASDSYGVASKPTIETWTDDILAVLDAEGCERAVMLGCGDFGLISLMAATTHPDRTLGLVVINGYARYYQDRTYPLGPSPPSSPTAGERLARIWGTRDLAERLAPSMEGDEAFLSWFQRAQLASMGPGSCGSVYEPNVERDCRGLLASVRTPTLVLHRRDDAYVSVEHGEFLARHIPEARFVELPGGDHLYFVGDADALLDEIQAFLQLHPRQSQDDSRLLATVLFTDIVGSTEHASSLGDRQWRVVLDDHDRVIRATVEAHRGRVVHYIGDGVLATFDGPPRAIHAASSVVDAMRPLGIEVRAGLHTGEIEIRGNDVGGIAVHIGARVGGLATPGQVLVTRTVKDLVGGSGITFADQGLQKLKGVQDEWQLFSVVSA